MSSFFIGHPVYARSSVRWCHDQWPISQSRKVCNYKDNLCNYKEKIQMFIISISQNLRIGNYNLQITNLFTNFYLWIMSVITKFLFHKGGSMEGMFEITNL